MFQHILVPVDLTGKNRQAGRIASELGAGGTADITLLHVIETIEDVPFEEIEPFYSGLERKAKEEIGKLAREFGDGHGEMIQVVVYGKRAEAIVDYASEHAIDLIVMTSHRVDAASPARGLATLSYKVGVLSPCSVLLVK